MSQKILFVAWGISREVDVTGNKTFSYTISHNTPAQPSYVMVRFVDHLLITRVEGYPVGNSLEWKYDIHACRNRSRD